MEKLSNSNIKPYSISFRNSTQNSVDSSHHNRVVYKKYINQVNQALQSMITAGRIKRMELISINNRALFNRSKVQRCEWVNKKHQQTQKSFLPDIENLNLKKRSPGEDRKKRKPESRNDTNLHLNLKQKQRMIDKLVEQQMSKIKTQNLLNSGLTQEQIIKEACQEIQEKILEKQMLSNKSRSKKTDSKILETRKIDHYRYIKGRKLHRRSVTQSVYQSSLAQIQKKNRQFMKEREEDKRYFLRRIKHTTLNG